jgi:hypothetical protein
MPTPEPLEDFAEEVHRCLVAGSDPTAPARLASTYLNILVENLRRRFRDINDETLFYDAATDAILNYAEKPTSFDPAKSRLLTYLTNSAVGDLKNALAKEIRRGQGQNKVVQELTVNATISMEIDSILSIEDDSAKDMIKQVLHAFSDPIDRQLLNLILDRERSTSAFVEVLGIKNHSQLEQQEIVKKHKDRIKARLKRLRAKIHE